MAKVIKRETGSVQRVGIGAPEPASRSSQRPAPPPEAEEEEVVPARERPEAPKARPPSAPPASRKPRPRGRPAGAPEGEAKLIVERARQDARALQAAVEKEVEETIADARQQGQAAGLSDTEELRGKMEQLDAAFQHEVEPEALSASLKMARRFFAAELKKHPEVIVDVVRQALLSARQQREIFVRVHPSHVEMLREHHQELVDVLGRAKEIDIREDAVLEPGGCMVETEIGAIDAQLETQFEVLARSLTRGGK